MERHGLLSYLVGFVLAVVLTAIPFYLVATHALPPSRIMYVIAAAAVLQILVHLRFFLHLNFTTTPAREPAGARLHRRPALHHGGRQPVDHDRPAQAHGDLGGAPPLGPVTAVAAAHFANFAPLAMLSTDPSSRLMR